MPFPQPRANARSPRRAAAVSAASTCSTASTPGTTSPPASSWPGWRCPASWRSSRRPRSASPARCWICCSPRTASPRVPVLALIDARLAVGETDGWHYDDLPEDAQAWRDTLASSTHDARDRARRTRLRRRWSATEQAAARSRRCRTAADDGNQWHDWPADPRLEPVDPLRLHRVLLPPLGVERDRLSRPGLPPRLPQPGRRRARTLGSRPTSSRRRPGAVRRPGRDGTPRARRTARTRT